MIEFKAVANKSNLQNDEQKTLYYPRVCNSIKIEPDRLIKDLCQNSSLNPISAKHVLFGLEYLLEEYMKRGYRVELPGIGIISPSIKGTPAESPSKLSSRNITSTHINFIANKRLKNALKKVDFKKQV